MKNNYYLLSEILIEFLAKVSVMFWWCYIYFIVSIIIFYLLFDCVLLWFDYYWCLTCTMGPGPNKQLLSIYSHSFNCTLIVIVTKGCKGEDFTSQRHLIKRQVTFVWFEPRINNYMRIKRAAKHLSFTN